MGTNDEILREFLSETKDNLDALDQNLIGLERNPDDHAAVDNVFRSLHSIKGAAGFFEFDHLESVAHAGENLLNAVREHRVQVDTETTSLLLSALDAMRDVLASIERTGVEGERDQTSLVHAIEARMARSGVGGERAAVAATPPPAPPPAAAQTSPAPPRPLPEVAATPPPAPPAGGGGGDGSRDGPRDAPREGEEPAGTIRVGVQVLDELMDLVGELVLSRNQIVQATAQATDARLVQSAQQLNRITSELQERVMKTRMQPIRHVWSRLPRIVRDLSLAMGKEVRVEMEGKETELDRSLIEAIKDPLVHLVRNAIDHGIETPADRVARGKPPQGTFRLRAYHESGEVIIEVADDGAGIDTARLKRAAVERGLLTSEAAAAMGAKEAMDLIFRPGLSTAERVTNISGRGVGMDVVRSNIEGIGGTIDVESELGVGTRFRIKIPLTLAIIPALMVTSAGGSFAIPQVNVVELVRVKRAEAERAIEAVQGTMVTRLRGRLLPLVDLRELLAGGAATSMGAASKRRADASMSSLHIAVLQANKRKFGLLVDGIEGSQEIVVKPLGRQLQDIPVYAGATILGDGRVALILDTLGVAQHGGLLGGDESAAAEEEASSAGREADLVRLLLAEEGDAARFAVPLDSVARLEKLEAARVETVGGREVVQYGDDILRLVRVPQLPGASRAERPSDRQVYVVVLHSAGAPVGLVVDRVLDIVEARAASIRPPTRPGAAGTVVVRERITELLDTAALVASAQPPEARA